ncbi:MAG: hypothetical protein FD174_3091 [Geobacteraceae bacterium]|nr:MAG: hypothetical protein FD174_3091 [Geobacteraceae bacterium]
MAERMVERVDLERLRRDAVCVIIRLGLGGYDLQGTAGNILVPESYVAWATVTSELGNEGNSLVTPEEYADACGLGINEVLARVHDKGSLFALIYGDSVAVPLPEKEAILSEIEV